MRNLSLILLVIAAGHFGATATKAQTQQEGHPVYLTFDVPVKLDSLPPYVKKFGVHCAACEGDQCNFMGDGHLQMWANVEHDLPATPEPHSFNGTVSVQVTVALSPQHHKLSTYACHLYLKSDLASCTVGAYHVEGTSGPNDDLCKSPWTKPQPGAVFVPDLHGDLAIDMLPPPAQIPSGNPQASPKPVLAPGLGNPAKEVAPKEVIVGPIPHKK